MKNITGEVSIQLDTERKLRFGNRAFGEFEQITGLTIDQVMADFGKASGEMEKLSPMDAMIVSSKALPISRLRDLIWCALLHDKAADKLTRDEVYDAMDRAPGETVFEKQQYLIEKVMDAYLATKTKEDLGSVKKKAIEKEEESKGPGTGNSSTPPPSAP